MSFHEFHGGQHPLDGVDALVTGGAGDGFVARMGQRGIEVVMCGESDPLQAVKDYIQGTVKPVLAGEHDHDHHHVHQHQHDHGDPHR
jgi:predicted Fe-Mo cluster-binding NifX family protein